MHTSIFLLLGLCLRDRTNKDIGRQVPVGLNIAKSDAY